AQSPTTGTQPGRPYWNTESTALEPGSFSRYQVAVAGLKTPMPVWPRPAQSPTTGTQPGRPNTKVRPAAPAPGRARRYQVAVAGSKVPMPAWPLPVQSPAKGTQPGAPNGNAARTGPSARGAGALATAGPDRATWGNSPPRGKAAAPPSQGPNV